jgi:uncharacterized damage-inducible protein DinB
MHLAPLFAYDADANRRLLTALRDSDAAKRERDVLAHLLTAKQVWLARLEGQPWTGAIWPDLSWDECADLVAENRTGYADYLGALAADAFENAVVYRNSRGERFETPRRDILMHVLIHGGYHRGQLARALRDAGHAPPNTDYITYVRQGLQDQ